MRRFVPIQHEFQRFYLRYDAQLYPIQPPDNWDSAKREMVRSLQYHGLFLKLSDSLTFSGIARELIVGWYQINGVIAEIDVLQYELNSETDEYELVFEGQLDLSEMERNDDEVMVKINSESLTKKLQSRYETEISIDNPESLDGRAFDDLPDRITIELLDRIITGENTLDIGTGYDSRNLNEARDRSVVLFTQNEPGAFSDLPNTFTPVSEIVLIGDGDTTDHWFFQNKQKEPIEVSFRLNFLAEFNLPAGSNSGNFNLEYRVYPFDEETSDGRNLTVRLTEPLRDPVAVIPGQTTTYNYSGTKKIIIQPNEGVALWMTHNFPGNPDFVFQIKSATLNPYGNTKFDPTQCQAFLPFNFFERFLQLMGAYRLESDYLSASRLAIANGFMIRNAPQKPISFTFAKLFQSFDSVEPIGLTVSGNTAKIEKRDYFYQKFLAYDFGDDITNVRFEFDKERAYSELKVGFETSNFTKEDALNEYAVRTVWTTPINTYQMELNMVSNIQASSNVIEGLRRVQFNENTERTFTRRGDSTIFFIDLRDDENKPRTWIDDYEEPPIALNKDGIYETLPNASAAYNLRLTPAQTLKKHGQWISFGMDKFLDKYYRFSSSTGGTGLITQKAGEAPVQENLNQQISDTGQPRYISERVKFEIPPMNLFNLLTERVGGVLNAYGIFRFRHDGVDREGYLMAYRPETLEVELQLIK